MFVFLARKGEKQVKNGRKYAIFKNWLDTHLKMETHDPNVYPTILGGVSQGFWSPFLDWGAGSATFLHLKTGTFVKSACFHFYIYTTHSLQGVFAQVGTGHEDSDNKDAIFWHLKTGTF